MLGKIKGLVHHATPVASPRDDHSPDVPASSARTISSVLSGLRSRTSAGEGGPHAATLQSDDRAVMEAQAGLARSNQAAPGADIEPVQGEPLSSVPEDNTSGARKHRFTGLRLLGKRAAPDSVTGSRSYFRGFGVTSITRATTPFYATTKSAEPKVTGAGNVPEERHAGLPPGLTEKTTPSASLQPASSKVLDKLALADTLLSVVSKKTPSTDKRDASPETLLNALQATQVRAGLDNAETVLVAMTLQTCFAKSPTPLKDGCEALRALQNMDLLDKLRGSSDGARGTSPDPAAVGEDKAWRFAQSISGVPGGMGMHLVEKLSATDAVPSNAHSSIAVAKRAILRSFLLAASHLTTTAQQRGQRLDNDPTSLFSSPHLNLAKAISACGENGWPGRNGEPTPANIPLTLAEKALLAAKEELREVDQHLASPIAHGKPFVGGTHGCRFSLAMMRGNMPTDEDRNRDGTLSEFKQVESRAYKTTQHHLNRALKKPTGVSRITTALRDHLLPGKNKSPFKAYNKLVADSAGSASSTPKLNAGMTVSHRSPIADGRAMSDMLGSLEAAIDTHIKGINFLGFEGLHEHAPVYGDDGKIDYHRLMGEDSATLLQQIARLAILKTTRDETLLLPRFGSPQGLSAAGRERAVANVLSQVRAPAGGFNMDTLRASIADTIAREDRPLTATRMLAWGGSVGGPADADAVNRIVEGTSIATSTWQAFAKGFDRIESGAAPRLDTPSLEGMSRHDAAELIASLVENEELGSGFSLSNGGNVQANTKGVSGIVSNVLLGLTSSIRVDLGGGRTRLVTFESGTSADRSTLRVGVSTLKRVEVGAGGSVGHSFGAHAPVTLSAGGDAAYAFQITEQEGAVFGFPRHLSGGVAGDRMINAEKAKLVRLLLDEEAEPSLSRPGNPEDNHSLVKRAYQAFGDAISIGRYESKTNDHIVTVDVTGGAGARIGDFRLGLPAGHVTGLRQDTETNYREHSGWLTNDKVTTTRSYKLSADAALLSLNGLVDAAHGDISGLAQLAAGNGASESADFFRYAETDVHSSILSEGQELPTSFASRSYSNPAAFAASLANHIDQLATDKSQRFFAARHGDDATRLESVEQEKEAITALVTQYLAEKDLTATPQMYWEFGRSNDRANRLRATRHVADKTGDVGLKEGASSELDALHTDMQFREGRFFINSKLRSRVADSGVNGVLGLNYSLRNRFTEQSLTFT